MIYIFHKFLMEEEHPLHPSHPSEDIGPVHLGHAVRHCFDSNPQILHLEPMSSPPELEDDPADKK
ncbi:MAG: hypothetical protein QS99_C0001G0018 [archaeon GW2011_AR4]|nr:MAG: hypothetical protein QS99_C0001G0018 [archaeon GW2011_AR4]